jgi:hypothetical protein
MKILVFTEGTILMHLSGRNVNREERVKQSQAADIQREERNIAYDDNVLPPSVEKGSVYDLASYIPLGNAVSKLTSWEKQGATISYLTSRRIKSEIETIRQILKKYDFPKVSNLYYRKQDEDYKDVAERIMPDILIEDDCESIGGKKEMTYTHINPRAKERIKLISVREFEGIDNLPDNLEELQEYIYLINKGTKVKVPA